MNILFRVDAGESVGMGHLMRCLALAQSLESENIRSHFVVNAEILALCKSRQDWVGELHSLPHFSDLKDEVIWLKSFCANNPIDGLVLDGYTFHEHYRQNLQSLDLPIICFDDMNNSGQLFADVVINGAEEAFELNYNETAPDAIFCLGERYRVLRNEFSASPSKPFSARTELLITMGGSDPAMLTLPILKALEAIDFKDPISVVSGAANAKVDSIAEFVENSRLNLTHHHDCQSIAKLMKQSRLAISAAGGSQFELLACFCPSVLVVVADNQVNATCSAQQQGWCETIDFRLVDEVFVDKKSALLNKTLTLVELAAGLWRNSEKLQTMHQQAQTYADTKGAQRVTERIRGLLNHEH